jgi:hypothetical protein
MLASKEVTSPLRPSAQNQVASELRRANEAAERNSEWEDKRHR